VRSPGIKPYLRPTSGNTGIAIAMIGAAKGNRVKLVMPSCASHERQYTLKALGAEVVLTRGRKELMAPFAGAPAALKNLLNSITCRISLRMNIIRFPTMKPPAEICYSNER